MIFASVALSKWPQGVVYQVPDAEPRETSRDIFDEQIRDGNPERQGGLAPLLEMVAARVAKKSKRERERGCFPLNAHPNTEDLALSALLRTIIDEHWPVTNPPGGDTWHW